MLQKTQAMRVLQEGCNRLGLPNSTAAALLQFLSVKRVHDQFVPEKDRQLRMSPGSKLDKLWHYMLLNTSVSACVHALLGGVVEHRGTDAWDLADDTKLLQRLYALNIMRLEGHEPDVGLWTEPGTALHTLHLTTSPVPALRSLPGGGRLYVTPSLTQQQQDQLVQALEVLYAQGAQQPQQLDMLEPEAAAAAAAAAAGTKRRRTDQLHPQQQQQQQQQQQEEELNSNAYTINLIVKDQMGREVHFKVSPHTKIEKVIKAYAEKMSVDFYAVNFLWDGDRILGHCTAEDYGIEDGETIDCIMSHAGC